MEEILHDYEVSWWIIDFRFVTDAERRGFWDCV
jgi:hypothetical protein